MATDKTLSEHPAPVAPRAPENTERGAVRELLGLLVKAQKAQQLYDGKNAISEKLEHDLFSRRTEFLESEGAIHLTVLAAAVAHGIRIIGTDAALALLRRLSEDGARCVPRFVPRFVKVRERARAMSAALAMETSATAMDSRVFLDRSRDALQQLAVLLRNSYLHDLSNQTQRTVAALLADLSHPDHQGGAIRHCVEPESYGINGSHYVL